MPAEAAWPAAALAAAWGLYLARRESRRPCLQLRLHESGAVEIDGVPVEDFRVAWRGALAFASWRDRTGRRRHRTWWPDTLPPAARRELRLAARVEDPAPGETPVAH